MPSNQPIELLSSTQSVCPICLKRVAAIREQQGEAVYLVKQCPEHGTFRTVVWRGPVPFSTWQRPKKPSGPRQAFTRVDRGCPFDCGLCPEHGQHTCTALLEITARCNLRCPVCFADAGAEEAADPSLRRIGQWYDRVLAASGPSNIQLSGGEPTVREDLPEIIALGRSKGFSFIQLNTNGVKLAEDPAYALQLRDAGLASVFLQFDGVSAGVHQALRGRDLCLLKEMALDHCGRAGLGVVLVPTLVPGVNVHEVGAIIRYAMRRTPIVRGVHFQPISYFGRYPEPPADEDRLTLGELMAEIARQTGQEVTAADFAPPACEHALCSFHGNFLVQPDLSLLPLGKGAACCSTGESGEAVPTALEGREKSVSFTARQWSLPMAASSCCGSSAQDTAGKDDLDRFLERARTHTFSLSAMAFQDAWNVDVERLKGCCIHVVSPAGNLIPFCAYNLTASDGTPLYRGQSR